MQVVNCTTPAQIFHALRRQVKRSFRKPLVVMTPKSLLRHPQAVSQVDELSSGRFQEVLDDALIAPDRVRRVLLCSGKVYYDLLERRTAEQTDAVAIVRLEQLYPWPEEQLKLVLAKYRRAVEWKWVQEESQNMGGWTFVEPRLRATQYPVEYIGRDASASPATGSKHVHDLEQADLVEKAFVAAGAYQVTADHAAQHKAKPRV